MTRFKWLWIACIISFFCPQTYAKDHCYSSMSDVLECFLKLKDNNYKYELVEEDNSNSDITIKSYWLYSQKWPLKTYYDIPSTKWKHKLTIYIPKKISYTKALLYINGGCNKNVGGFEEFVPPKEQIDYVSIALNNRAPVIELQDTPNQFLIFNGRPQKEDQIIAYTYKKFVENPYQNAYLAGHLPMAKAVSKAMDASEQIIKQDANISLTGFVLSGASKRGWAAWLTAIGDKRVEALVPIVINVLNAQKSISHICESYGGKCPPTLQDYEQQKIIDIINDAKITALMKIEDPFSYLNVNKYKPRLAIPKYIINASGDDFFVPDSSRWYFKYLPGDDNYIRYLPNSMHFISGNFISDSTESLPSVNQALDSYFYFILHKTSLPKISWVFAGDTLEITTSAKPILVKLWVANNKASRDFRYITSYSGLRIRLKWVASHFSNSLLCDNCYQEIPIPIDCQDNTACNLVPLPYFKNGWQASFAELHYNVDDKSFVITTEINITPDIMPKKQFAFAK